MTTVTPQPIESGGSRSTDAVDLGFRWQSGFAVLGDAFSTPVKPTPLAPAHLVAVNDSLALELELRPGALAADDAVQALAGNRPIAGAEARATVYSGHQFGVWAGQLGDGRALLIGQAATASGSQEIQLKGAGRTPFSRMGDGRAVLRSSIREFLASEAIHALRIPTTRALAVVGSPTPIRRETMETAAVVTRVAPSFIRFGHFEHFAAAGRQDELRALADYVIDRWYPECRTSGRFGGNADAAFLEQVSERTARMVARWQAAGFCHGVMNTDNMSILGLTIDYGPFQFLDGFDPNHICNHSDEQGRYAYHRQPNVAYWNLHCLAQAVLPLIGDQALALAALESYKRIFPVELEARLCGKLGFETPPTQAKPLVEGVLRLLAVEKVDWPIFWRRLAEHRAGASVEPVRDLFLDRPGFDAWMLLFKEHSKSISPGLSADLMLNSSPFYVLRNHVAELAIRAAQGGDFSVVNKALELMQSPFAPHPDAAETYSGFPPDWAQSLEISCSS